VSDWWLGLQAAQAPVTCGGKKHRLRWEAGELVALDHEDPEAERTLAALGGQRCACVDLLDAWAKHTADLSVLVLASRGPTDAFAAPQGRPSDEELPTLLGLGGGLPDRLVATVAATWAERLDEAEPQLPRLQAALYGRAATSLRGWLGEPAARIKLSMGEPARLSRNARAIRAQLPFSWLVDVWAKGLATVWGRFCLAATSDDGLRWTLTTVGPDLGEARPLVIELPPPG
jgi:hypothetical protein